MESFYRTHKYLVEHVNSPVKRELMKEIDWNNRLIGIKGSRGVGKTTFLLEYAKENFGTDRSCLYINLNHLYFTERSLVDFADEFRVKGGKTLLIDQVFKYPDWSNELKYCYDNFPDLKIIFTGSSVMRLKEENPVLSGLVDSYNLRGFSFREYLNLMAGTNFRSYKLEEILKDHVHIASEICSRVKPLAYFQDYLHHGFYPFFLEKRNFSENLIKTINMTMEVDILFLKQIELTYLPKVRKLLYLLSVNAPSAPNVSQLSKEIQTSRATVVNYIKYLKDARLINMLYPVNEEFPKKPAMVYMHNTNLMYPMRPSQVEAQAVRETFFYNTLHKDNHLNKGEKNAQFLVNKKYNFKIEGENTRGRNNPDFYYVTDLIETGGENKIPLWIFGLLY
ncbi:ATP-binding protein [Coprobacter tertius]|uniref:AAA family ATPase n=1 Tax=Coprobacter tertius TaxID=2944915 RepID=A0ABT1ME62_9BACT|nr:AAA family ATPase [Coprobacter tertius]MCP9610915.1 AAA family ATPase [Coprobacter tertius]